MFAFSKQSCTVSTFSLGKRADGFGGFKLMDISIAACFDSGRRKTLAAHRQSYGVTTTLLGKMAG